MLSWVFLVFRRKAAEERQRLALLGADRPQTYYEHASAIWRGAFLSCLLIALVLLGVVVWLESELRVANRELRSLRAKEPQGNVYHKLIEEGLRDGSLSPKP